MISDYVLTLFDGSTTVYTVLHCDVVALLLYTTVLYCTLMRYTAIVRTVL